LHFEKASIDPANVFVGVALAQTTINGSELFPVNRQTLAVFQDSGLALFRAG
jgi:hypothetical protein